MRIILVAILTLFAYPTRLFAQKFFSQDNPLFAIAENNKVGYIDKVGKIVLPPIFPNGGDFSEGLAAVRLKGRYGFIDQTGHFVIAPQFDWAGAFVNGLAIVFNQGHPYYIDQTGHSPFICNYAAVGSFSRGRAYVETHSGKDGYIDFHGKLIIDTLYDYIGPFHDGVAVVKIRAKNERQKIAVIDSAGHVIIPPGSFEGIQDFSGGYAVVDTKDGRTGVIDRRGKILFSRFVKNHIYLSAKRFCSGIGTIDLYKYWIPEKKGVTSTDKIYPGFLDLHNKIVLDDTTVADAREFSQGRSFIKHEDDGYTMIDTRMQAVGRIRFLNVQEEGFENGYAIAETEDGWGVVDTNAHFVPIAAYKDIDACWMIGNYFFFRTNEGDTVKYGIATLKGREISKPYLDYFDFSGFENGLLKVEIDGKMAYLDSLGKIVWQGAAAQDTALNDLNIDYMMRGYFYAYSSPEKSEEESHGGGWAISRNIPRKLSGNAFEKSSLSIIVDTGVVDTFSRSFRGFPVYVCNTTKDSCQFHAEDSRLNMKMQALDEGGNWKDIDYLPHSWCGNSYHIIALEPGAYWKFVIPRFEGEIPTKLRLELQFIDRLNPQKNKVLYSNIIDGKVNPGQFWNKRQYYPRGIMDPYVD
jgi:hypothetical protein